jgi:hypothetical protein
VRNGPVAGLRDVLVEVVQLVLGGTGKVCAALSRPIREQNSDTDRCGVTGGTVLYERLRPSDVRRCAGSQG